MRRSEAILITYLRSRYQPRAVLVDQNLDLYSGAGRAEASPLSWSMQTLDKI